MEKFGLGVYTLTQAARLVHTDRASIKRWLFGYDYKHTRAQAEPRRYHSDPLWTPQYAEDELGEKVIGFQDLLEVRIVREFVQHGVPLLVIRRCLEVARREFQMDDYPLSTQRFSTDGRTIFREVLREGHESEILDLRNRQYVIKDIIKPSLYAGIDYEAGVAKRWYPQGKDRRTIVIDPDLQFGKPTVRDAGIPTETLYASYLAEGKDKAAVARIYELPTRQVDAAIRFEERLAA